MYNHDVNVSIIILIGINNGEIVYVPIDMTITAIIPPIIILVFFIHI